MDYETQKKNLLEFLERQGTLTPVNIGMVEQYVYLLEVFDRLKADIDKVGVTLTAGNGVKTTNKSVGELKNNTRSRLDILGYLNYNDKTVAKVREVDL